MKRADIVASIPGLLLASCVPLKASAANIRVPYVLRPGGFFPQIRPYLAVAYSYTFTASGETGTINVDSTGTQYWGATDDGNYSFSGALSGGGTTPIRMSYTATAYGRTVTGNLTRTRNGNVVSTTRSDGASIGYTFNGTSCSGNAYASTGAFAVSNSGSAASYTSSVAGTLRGGYATYTSQNPPPPKPCRVQCLAQPIKPLAGPKGLGQVGVAFDGAAIFLGFLPGMQGFSLGCAFIGFAIGLYEY